MEVWKSVEVLPRVLLAASRAKLKKKCFVFETRVDGTGTPLSCTKRRRLVPPLALSRAFPVGNQLCEMPTCFFSSGL